MPTIPIQPLTADACSPYGTMLGKPPRTDGDTPVFVSPPSDFWREHLFDPGTPDPAEILWVRYRNRDLSVSTLEAHDLTEQAIVPLTGSIIHVVARSMPDGAPDLSTMRAFRIDPGQGLVMHPRTWHATRVEQPEVTCLMLTRASTTRDLVAHLRTGAPACESRIGAIETHRLD
ncbi:MAG: Ureidoglycolate lyase [Burkholderia lata]|uniref:Ureidoglycolate lyase n=1 Tax=Burkholderia lata (strain ATCC 17760 / DSM 23089 / LMG 22485 / NCIMB 9086 / R18194 / 383) TaxID=482957 RepID=A0A833PR17_BURL3|nr:ureidoglycolate lyase [Burkholderia lata]KAF1034167.1 MAG: Ureidoglycolate lyase [Burkholderia lata]